MLNEMEMLELAEKFESTAKWLDDNEYFNCGQDRMRHAASTLRTNAAGEYKQVIHARCIDRGNDCFCSNCGKPNVAHGQKYCPDCGARMDGGDDSDA